jgi:hypothetical protein
LKKILISRKYNNYNYNKIFLWKFLMSNLNNIRILKIILV